MGLHYLKNAYDENNESCVERFLENPYWQYFCGFEHFQHEFPLKPTTLVKWRQRIGEAGIEKLFYQTLLTAQKLGLLNRQMKRDIQETKRLKMYLRRITRELRRKTGYTASWALEELLQRSERLLQQKKHDTNKMYSCHAPEVECISTEIMKLQSC